MCLTIKHLKLCKLRSSVNERLVLLLVLSLGACDFISAGNENISAPAPAPTTVRGVVTATAFGEGNALGPDTLPDQHDSLYVRRQDVLIMEDNDIRGFLEGRFVHGWNQSGQSHVRLGRVPHTERFGENEIIRVLHRWDELELPLDTIVEDVALTVTVEDGPSEELEVLLYPVNKDWSPGGGGTLRNNLSPPKQGEVWWQEVGHGIEPWGLPGASFASDTHPLTDTSVMPLAVGRYKPVKSTITFSSTRLTAYVQQRIRTSKPLLFLLKLPDTSEDVTRPALALFSADYGEGMMPERRPQLRAKWSSPSQLASHQQDVILETGRFIVLPRLETPGAKMFSISFLAEDGAEQPWIEVRGGVGGVEEPWRPAFQPFKANWDWIEVRLRAAHNPVAFGSSIETEIRDTWIRTKAPEDQRVVFSFVAPSGTTYNVDANYLGEFRWHVKFTPNEIGRWRYFWEDNFTWNMRRGPDSVFDVIAQDMDIVLTALKALQTEISQSDLSSAEERLTHFERRFNSLQRAAISLLNPETFHSTQGSSVREKITEIRATLASEKLAETPSEWARPW